MACTIEIGNAFGVDLTHPLDGYFDQWSPRMGTAAETPGTTAEGTARGEDIHFV